MRIRRFSALVLTCLASTQVSGRWCEVLDPNLATANPMIFTTDEASRSEPPKTNPLAKATQLPDNAGSVKIVQLPL